MCKINPLSPKILALNDPLQRARGWISLLKGALNERDYWESAAAAHEAAEFPTVSTKTSMGKKKSVGKRTGAGGGSSTISSAPVNWVDLKIRPLSGAIPSSVPRSVSNQVVWDVVKINSVITVPTSGIVETNFQATLNSHPQVASWTALFDQWCIPRMSVTFESQYMSNSVSPPCFIVTALDFDNVTNLGTIGLLEDYSNANNVVMSQAVRFTRSIKPCLKVAGAIATGQSVSQLWCDSAQPAIPWFGIRSIAGSSGTTYPISAFLTIWFAFRNQI